MTRSQGHSLAVRDWTQVQNTRRIEPPCCRTDAMSALRINVLCRGRRRADGKYLTDANRLLVRQT